MSSRQYITTTNLDEHHALAWQGAQAFASFEQIQRLLSSRLSPEHSSLFAEPLPDDVRRKTDWYYLASNQSTSTDPASETTQAVRLVDMSPEAQTPIREKLLTLGRDIYNLSQELKNSSESNQSTAGNLLEMALTFPNEEFIYVIGNTPILTAWGFTSATGVSQPEMLTRLGASPFPATPNTLTPNGISAPTTFANQVNDQTRVHNLSWLWAILAFLIGAILCGLLLYFLGPRLGIIGLSGCTREIAPTHNATTAQSPSEELLQLQSLENSLRAELERLQQELLARLAQCEKTPLTPQPEEPFIEPHNTPLLEEEIPENVPALPGFSIPEIPDDLTDEMLEEMLEDTPEDIIEEPKANNMEIPDQPEDLDFLEGCWDAPTGLVNIDSNQPVKVEYCFDGKGNGKVKITEFDRNGNPSRICEGSAQARLEGDQLSIEDNGAQCPDNKHYYANELSCYKDKNNNTVCKGTSKNGSQEEWGPIPFRGNQE